RYATCVPSSARAKRTSTTAWSLAPGHVARGRADPSAVVWRRWDSNPRTSCMPCKRSSQLSYAPGTSEDTRGVPELLGRKGRGAHGPRRYARIREHSGRRDGNGRAAFPLRRPARERDRGEVAGAVGGAPDLLRAESLGIAVGRLRPGRWVAQAVHP